MIDSMSFYTVGELPAQAIDKSRVLEAIGRQNFMIVYDFTKSVSMVVFNDQYEDTICKLTKTIPGMRFAKTDCNFFDIDREYIAFSVYRRMERHENRLFNDVFNFLSSGYMAILYINSSTDEINSVKTHFERVLSSKSIRESEPSFKTMNGRANSTVQRELYHESEEKLMLNDMIESLNNTILGNGLVYKIFLLVPKEFTQICTYIDSHFFVLSEFTFRRSGSISIIEYLSKRQSIPLGINNSKEFINFYGSYRINHTLPTVVPVNEDGLEIGNLVKDGTLETNFNVRVDPTTLNLGFIITGLPGSGKTREIMSILDSLLRNKHKKPAVFVVTPTSEWKDFAFSHSMFFIKIYEDSTPINFFRCPETINSERFYGDLAMILSSAANAGPYRNPMEKCMLNAFRRVYNQNKTPDPIKVYKEIEESIVTFHGKRTGNVIRYTKHGENIKSALENLRGIINKEQYGVEDGLRIEDLIDNGAIFDFSNASANTKRQIYALILNQIYSLVSKFDTNGDNELRLVICLEESHTIFGDPDSPAVQDIKQRIQDFRKQGIGLILLTHNVTDIDTSIRRLCQLKLYFKQAPDTAAVASKDLIFTYADQDEVALKLKTLDSRIGAFSYVSKKGEAKLQQDTIFIKTRTYNYGKFSGSYNPIVDYLNKYNLRAIENIKCKMSLKPIDYQDLKSTELKDFSYIRISYLGEEILTTEFSKLESLELSLFKNKDYKIDILNKRGRVIKEINFIASEKIYLGI